MLNDRELATVLAALRAWQNLQQHESPAAEVMDVATSGGTLTPLDDGEVDELCERLNTSSAIVAIPIAEANLIDGHMASYLEDWATGMDEGVYDKDAENKRDYGQADAAHDVLVAAIAAAEGR